MKDKTRFITQGAVVAVLYIVLTMVSNAFGLASGVIQVRLSEALTILPMFFPSAIPGLFVGCIIANCIFLGLSSIICVWFIKKWIQLEYVLWRQLINPIVIGFVILLIISLLNWLLQPLLGYFFSMLIGGVVGVVAYTMVVYFSKIFTNKEIKFFKFTRSKISKRL